MNLRSTSQPNVMTEWLVANHYIHIDESSTDWSAKCDDYISWLQISKFILMNFQLTVQLNVMIEWMAANH